MLREYSVTDWYFTMISFQEIIAKQIDVLKTSEVIVKR
jgi:hypothetical protein